jgi:hypothetical protein
MARPARHNYLTIKVSPSARFLTFGFARISTDSVICFACDVETSGVNRGLFGSTFRRCSSC